MTGWPTHARPVQALESDCAPNDAAPACFMTTVSDHNEIGRRSTWNVSGAAYSPGTTQTIGER